MNSRNLDENMNDCNPYEVLDVNINATPEEITSAYLEKMNKARPKKNQTFTKVHDENEIISLAYEILINPVKRKKYDLREGLKSAIVKLPMSVSNLTNDRNPECYRKIIEAIPALEKYLKSVLLSFDTENVLNFGEITACLSKLPL